MKHTVTVEIIIIKDITVEAKSSELAKKEALNAIWGEYRDSNKESAEMWAIKVLES